MADYEWADLIDSADRVRTLIDPTSSICISCCLCNGEING